MEWRLVCCLVIMGSLSLAVPVAARQVRINRYAASVQEDDVVQADVREVTPTPYAPAGYRPEGRSFWLPGEIDVEIKVEDLGESSFWRAEATTTETPTTTTEKMDLITTTGIAPTEGTSKTDTQISLESRAGRGNFRAPYPPAGYRPSRAFRLPTELDLSQQASNATSNANHPICGVSTDPLKPTPNPGAKDEPDAENVLITGKLGPAVVVARAPKSSGIPVAIPLRSQPLLFAPPRGFAYATHVEQHW